MDVYLGVAHRHHRRGLFPSPRHEDRQKGVGLYVVLSLALVIGVGILLWFRTPNGKKWLANL